MSSSVLRYIKCRWCGKLYESVVPVCPDCGKAADMSVRHVRRMRSGVWKKTEKIVEESIRRRGITNYRRKDDGTVEVSWKSDHPMARVQKAREKMWNNVVVSPQPMPMEAVQKVMPAPRAGKILWNQDTGPAPGEIAPEPVHVHNIPKPTFNVIAKG